jgi:radical SAM superfamily enzyme YgiQ (UPF0313 family)
MERDRRILLISPRIDSRFTKSYRPELSENLGLAYLAGYLESRGVTATILDLNSRNLNTEDLINLVKEGNYPLVGISGNSPYYLSDSINFSRLFREKGIVSHITIGGHSATFRAEQVLNEYATLDSVVRGEGEITLYELFEAINNNRDLRGVLGITYRDKGKIQRNENRPVITDLDNLPFPNHYNLEAAIKSGESAHILTSRGCPGGCSFCIVPLSTRWRPRSPRNVLEEITLLYNKGARNFVIDDENYTGHCDRGRDRAIEIANLIIDQGLRIRYKASLRVDDINEALLERMIASGLTRVNVGVESFNQRQLDLYNKHITPEQSVKVIEMLIRMKLNATLGMIMFDPYVSLDELQNNHDNMRRFATHFNFKKTRTHLRPMKGSAIWSRLKNEGLLIEKKDYDDFYHFKNPEAARVFESMECSKETMKELERDYEKFIEAYLKLGKKDRVLASSIKSTVETKMTLMWLDILQHLINSAKQNRTNSPVPQDIIEQQKKISKLLSDAMQLY